MSSFFGLRHVYVVCFAIIVLSSLVSCGKFEAIKGGNDEAILYSVNTSTVAFVGALDEKPLPMPTPEPNDPGLAPLDIPPIEEERQVIEPFSGNEKIKPLADGLVEPANLAINPYKSGGRISMRFPGGEGGTCSAQFIGNSGVLLTAAHCIYDKKYGGFVNGLTFRQRYNSGSYASSFDWQCVAIVAGWTAKKWPYDYAFVKVRGVPSSGVGMKINVKASHVDAMGYPINYGNTQVMHHVSGNKDAANPSRMPNKMREGASGGGWIADDGSAVSVNSFYIPPDTSFLYGPVLTSASLKLYDFVARGCIDQITGTGMRTSVNEKAEESEVENVLTVATHEIAAAAKIVVGLSSDCTCEGSVQAKLLNESDETQLVGVQEIVTGVAQTSATKYLAIEGSSEKVLGCTREPTPATTDCAVDHVWRVSSSRSISSDKVDMPAIVPGVTMAAALAIRDVNQCVESCEKGDPNECFNLGDQAIAALAPLGKFVNKVDNSGSVPDGAVVAKQEIIAEYGGDPSKDEDVCLRSGMEREGSSLKNHGLQCAIITKAVFSASTFKTRLSMQPTVRGFPTSWTSAYSNAGANGNQTLFPDSTNGPKIDFIGAGSNPLNQKFSGDVYGVTATSDRTLAVATSKGCLTGAYKK